MYQNSFERLNALILVFFYLHFLGNQKKKSGKRKSGERHENPQKSIEQDVAEAKISFSDLEKVCLVYIPRRPQKLEAQYIPIC